MCGGFHRSCRRLFVDDLVAQRDAVVADEDAWSRDQPADLVLGLAAKRARVAQLSSHDLTIVSRDHWEKIAPEWAGWARRPNFDSYWEYASRFFELVPPAGGTTLEVGCGEGRVSRDLAARGHRVVAVDSSPTLIRLAHNADGSIAYARCDAAALPFIDEAFDVVVAYNSLMDFDDMEGSVREAGRVLKPGGVLCASITHPLQDAGKFESHDAEARFIITDSYLGEPRPFEEEVERDGHRMHFKGWAYPVEAYSRAMEKAGLVIEAIREPAALVEAVAKRPEELRWARIPLFLMWRARKAN